MQTKQPLRQPGPKSHDVRGSWFEELVLMNEAELERSNGSARPPELWHSGVLGRKASLKLPLMKRRCGSNPIAGSWIFSLGFAMLYEQLGQSDYVLENDFGPVLRSLKYLKSGRIQSSHRQQSLN